MEKPEHSEQTTNPHIPHIDSELEQLEPEKAPESFNEFLKQSGDLKGTMKKAKQPAKGTHKFNLIDPPETPSLRRNLRSHARFPSVEAPSHHQQESRGKDRELKSINNNPTAMNRFHNIVGASLSAAPHSFESETSIQEEHLDTLSSHSNMLEKRCTSLEGTVAAMNKILQEMMEDQKTLMSNYTSLCKEVRMIKAVIKKGEGSAEASSKDGGETGENVSIGPNGLVKLPDTASRTNLYLAPQSLGKKKSDSELAGGPAWKKKKEG